MIGLRRNTVELQAHQEEWEAQARRTMERLRGILGGAAKDIAHVGSTAVPAIMAKPIIDIAVAAENFQDILAHQEALKAEGFFYRPNAQTSICDQLLLA